jgi:hypothetical protein
MAPPLLDICDSNLQLWNGSEPLRSPGYALHQGNGYAFGNPARAAARLRPRDINTRFWWLLNTEPLQPALGPARHSADMVHAHLLDIHERGGRPDELLLAVSGSMQRNQLALLLGIIQACPFDAVGLVNRSAALGSLYVPEGRLFHLEIQLHQAVLTELGTEDGEVLVRRTTPIPGCGVLQLQERLIEVIAAGFIRQTRFDPRRKAESEQSLYDALPDALRALEQAGETNLEINGYLARVNRADLEACGERLFLALSETIGSAGRGDHVLLDPIATLLPGLGRHLPDHTALPGDALREAVSLHGERLVQREQNLHFVTALPVLDRLGGGAIEPVALEPATRAAPPSPATHLLQGGAARPLPAHSMELGGGCELYTEGGQWMLRGAGLDDARVDGRPCAPGQHLQPGALIEAGGGRYTLIEVLP